MHGSYDPPRWPEMLGETSLCLKVIVWIACPQLISAVVGYEGGVRYDSKKPDGAPFKRLDVTRLNALGWKANTDLRDGIARTYAWYAAQLPAPALAEDG